MRQDIDHTRFERLLTDSIWQLAWRHAWRWCGSQEDAEDLLQESLVLAMQRIAQLRDDGAFKTWLLAIVRHRGLSALRAKRRQQVTAVAAVRPDGMRPAAGVNEDPRVEALTRALRSLPVAQQLLLKMHYMDGMEAREIAQVERTSRGAIELRLHRARGALRRAIEQLAAPGSSKACREGSRIEAEK